MINNYSEVVCSLVTVKKARPYLLAMGITPCSISVPISLVGTCTVRTMDAYAVVGEIVDSP